MRLGKGNFGYKSHQKHVKNKRKKLKIKTLELITKKTQSLSYRMTFDNYSKIKIKDCKPQKRIKRRWIN